MSHDFILGATARLPVTITALVGNTMADPGGLVLKIRKPDQALVTLTYGTDAALVKASVGLYYVDVLLDQAGRWKWRWEASAPNTGVVEGWLEVRPSIVL